MNEQPSDFEWLQQFARAGNQAAFREIVRRHIDLVFATAMRKVSDAGGAEEISQNVFSALARKSWQFAPDDSLPAWLYKTTLLESQLWLRGEMRRRRREETAADLGTTMKSPDEQAALGALIPLLDEAMLSLRERDRAALLLRFFENKPLRAVGASLGVGEDAAQKRVAGALEKLSVYFQRRGFKTATLAATTAALEQTAMSAPVSVANSVVLAAAKVAPPAMVGLTAWLARLASLTKFQTATVCIAFAVVPAIWQLKQQQLARKELSQLTIHLQKGQTELSMTRAEIDRYETLSTQLADSVGSATASAKKRAESAAQFTSWKARLRAKLLAGDYHWPADSPFVRIPKSVLPMLGVRVSVDSSGTLSQAARELLGLTPEEREQIEAALHDHLARVNQMIDNAIYETNHASRNYIPTSAVASQAWFIPPLGDEAQRLGTQLRSSLQNMIGDERWPLVQGQLDSSGGINTFSQILNLDAGTDSQEAVVWIQNNGGQYFVQFGFASGSATSSYGVPLELFEMGADDRLPQGWPIAVLKQLQPWLEQQIATLSGKGAAQ